MPDQKLDNLLNLAMESTSEEREKSGNLNVGYNAQTQLWDVIVKYSGPESGLAGEGITAVPLLGNYAVVTLPENMLNTYAARPQVEFIEIPKRMYFAMYEEKVASCVLPVQRSSNEIRSDGIDLSGKDILVGIVDSGVDYRHPDFRNADGSSRILSIWDQSAAAQIGGMMPGNPPKGYSRGVEYTKEMIDEALALPSEEGYKIVPERDFSGHGTAVLGIMAGNGRASGSRNRGLSYESNMIAVKLAQPGENSFPRTTELMQGVDYLVRQAMALNRPMVINLSFGNNYGSHRGDSLLENYLDTVSSMSRIVICTGTGNNGNGNLHTNGKLGQGETQEIELGISSFESVLNVQFWKNYADEIDIYVEAPSGERIGPLDERLGPQRYPLEDVQLLIYYGKPGPFQLTQEIYFDFIPRGNYINSGVWKFILVGKNIKEGEYELWLPGGGVLNPNTGFFLPRADGTLTIPSTARRVISVGAYNSGNDTLADFSGRGGVGMTEKRTGRTEAGVWGVKPDLVAPGVDVVTTAVGGGYAAVTGTSFATPFVSGSAALMMEWGIVQGNDPYLYGEKVKAYLQRGARVLPGYEIVPNPETGYGALCLRDSLPG